LEKEEILSRLVELDNMLSPAFEKAYGEIKAIDALILGVDGKVMVFVGEINSEINLAFILEPVQYPRKWVLNVLAYAGHARKFYQLYEELRNWAKAEGYDELRGYGTEATFRLARKNYGWKEIYRVYADPLR
jgi:hypothetical protein